MSEYLAGNNWTASNKKLFLAAVSAIKKDKFIFECPLFNTIHDIHPGHFKGAMVYWPFRYRGFDYCICREYNIQAIGWIWTLVLVVKVGNVEKWNTIMKVHDNMYTFIEFSVDGKLKKIVTEGY